MQDPTVIQAKRYGVTSCHRNETLHKAASMMAFEDISALVVVDDHGYLAGILSRIDLIRAYRECQGWENEPVENWMVHKVITVSPRDHLSDVADILLQNHIHRVIAVQDTDQGKRPVAVFSAADLVYHMAKAAE